MKGRRRSVRDVGEADLARGPVPIYTVWELTLRCDQACRHCGSRAGRAREDELGTEEVLALGGAIRALGGREITLAGGEAYLRSDLLVIVRQLADLGLRVSVLTGGRAFGPELARGLKAAGATTLAVSIDGLADAHEALRGVPGGWRAALDALDAARAAGLRLAANTQVNRLNLHQLRDLAALLRDRGVRGWQVQITIPMGRAADHPETLLQPWDMLELVETLADIQRAEIARAAAEGDVAMNVSGADDVGYYGPHEAVLRSPPGGEAAHWWGCQAGRYVLGLEADGHVKPCLSMTSGAYRCGSTREQPLPEIWRSAPGLERHRARCVEDLWGACRTCYYADICLGGCPATAHAFFGRAGNNPYCWHRAEQLRLRGLRERVEPRVPAPGEPFGVGTFDLVVEPWEGAGPV